jgi:hypothetical protein
MWPRELRSLGSFKTSIAVIDLEGCSPLQPWEQNIVPTGSTAPRDRRAFQVWIKTSIAIIDFGGLQSLAAAGGEHCPNGLGGAEGPAPSI